MTPRERICNRRAGPACAQDEESLDRGVRNLRQADQPFPICQFHVRALRTTAIRWRGTCDRARPLTELASCALPS